MVKDYWDLIHQLPKIRKTNYDLALAFSQIGSFYTKISAADNYIDFTTIEAGSEISVTEMCLKVLEKALITTGRTSNPDYFNTEYWIDNEDIFKADKFLDRSKYNENYPLIAIHCGGHYFPRKRWPLPGFIQLIHRLKSEFPSQIVLVGGIEDLHNSLEIKFEIPEVLVAAGCLKLSETAALLQRCQLFIGNDSGPLHLGAAMNIKTLGLFGPTTPKQFHPYCVVKHRYVYKKTHCSPCYKFRGSIFQYLPRCSKPYCMEGITTEDLLPEIEALLTDAPISVNHCLQ